MEEDRALAGSRGAHGGCSGWIEGPLRKAQGIAPPVDLLDVDPDLPLGGNRDQGEAAGVAEVEAQPGPGFV